jgi:hypothetical protein
METRRVRSIHRKTRKRAAGKWNFFSKYGTPKSIKSNDFILLKNETPKDVQILSIEANKSYSPSINKSILSLKTLPRKTIAMCKTAEIKEPLEIEIDGKCVPYTDAKAKRQLLHNLAANKHIDMTKVIPPKQRLSNCWFNTMFVTFFISDKGRTFYHFFRELMISGKQQDGTPIPNSLRNAFALFNFAIDSALSGSEYAYKMNTNDIIAQLYHIIHNTHNSIYNIKEAGNPVHYYLTIMNYLHNQDSKILFVQNGSREWKRQIEEKTSIAGFIPNVIILEFMEDRSIRNKSKDFRIGDATYEIDSVVIRDTDKQHFSALLTGEHKEYGYDGISFHRIVPFLWKELLNKDQEWGFEGSFKDLRQLFRWNFLNGYQLLMYYRIK